MSRLLANAIIAIVDELCRCGHKRKEHAYGEGCGHNGCACQVFTQ